AGRAVGRAAGTLGGATISGDPSRRAGPPSMGPGGPPRLARRSALPRGDPALVADRAVGPWPSPRTGRLVVGRLGGVVLLSGADLSVPGPLHPARCGCGRVPRRGRARV